MYQQQLDVTLDGRDVQRITCDQRDIAALEATDWYGEPKVRVLTLRHMAYTCMRRTGAIPADTTWSAFNDQLCVHVDGVAQDDDGEGEQGPNPSGRPGRTGTRGHGS